MHALGPRAAALALLLLVLAAPRLRAEPSRLAAEHEEDRVELKLGGRPLATYVFVDGKILRPYFANVHTADGVLATRHHPPREGQELTDHATMHPGISLGFGDLSGADFWRNRAKVVHVKFVKPPAVDDDRITFTVHNDYVSGEKTICAEICRHTVAQRPAGVLFVYDSSFRGESPFTFGDQEEMGLGVRVAADLKVRGGNGTIRDSAGRTNEKQIWGHQAHYCEYAGEVDGRRVGVLVFAHPDNFRQSWIHARDYGFMALNPFGRSAFMKGEPSKVTVKPGETLRLRFGVLVYSCDAAENVDAKAAFDDFVKTTRDDPEPGRPEKADSGSAGGQAM